MSISVLSVAQGLDSSLSSVLNVLTMPTVQISFKGPTTGLDPCIFHQCLEQLGYVSGKELPLYFPPAVSSSTQPKTLLQTMLTE